MSVKSDMDSGELVKTTGDDDDDSGHPTRKVLHYSADFPYKEVFRRGDTELN